MVRRQNLRLFRRQLVQGGNRLVEGGVFAIGQHRQQFRGRLPLRHGDHLALQDRHGGGLLGEPAAGEQRALAVAVGLLDALLRGPQEEQDGKGRVGGPSRKASPSCSNCRCRLVFSGGSGRRRCTRPVPCPSGLRPTRGNWRTARRRRGNKRSTSPVVHFAMLHALGGAGDIADAAGLGVLDAAGIEFRLAVGLRGGGGRGRRAAGRRSLSAPGAGSRRAASPAAPGPAGRRTCRRFPLRPATWWGRCRRPA